MPGASRFVAALFIGLSFASASAEVLFGVGHGFLCLACSGFAVLYSENIVLVRLWLNQFPVKFELEFIYLRCLIFFLYQSLFNLFYRLILNFVNLLKFLK